MKTAGYAGGLHLHLLEYRGIVPDGDGKFPSGKGKIMKRRLRDGWVRRGVRTAITRNRDAEAVGLVIGYGEQLAYYDCVLPARTVTRAERQLDAALKRSAVSTTLLLRVLDRYQQQAA